MRPLRHNFLEVVSWVAAFFCSVLGNACFKSIANAKKRSLYSVYFPRISHSMLAHCIHQREAIGNATRTELPPHLSLTLLLLGQHHKTR